MLIPNLLLVVPVFFTSGHVRMVFKCDFVKSPAEMFIPSVSQPRFSANAAPVGIVEELCRNPSFSPVSDTGELDSILAVLRYNTRRAAWPGPFLIKLFAIDKASLFNLRERSVGIIHVPHVQ